MRVNEALAIKLKDFRDGDRLTASSYVVVERQIVDNTTIIKDNLKNGQDSRKVYLKKAIFKKFLNVLKKYIYIIKMEKLKRIDLIKSYL